MAGTKIYGASDDLVEFDGDVRGEVSCYGTDDDGHPGLLIICSDGTILNAKYGKSQRAIWQINVVKKGTLFDKKNECDDEDDNPHSDVIVFKAGLKFAYAATEWEKVK